MKGDHSALEARGSRLIVLAGPGTSAREMYLPYAWRAWLLLIGLLSIAGSMLLGRKARAWVDESAAPMHFPVRVETSPERAIEPDVTHVPLDLPAEPDGPAVTTRDGSSDKRAFRANRALAGRTLSLFDVNTKLAMAVAPFDGDGAPLADAFAALKRFMRCRRTGDMADMSPHLIGLLTRIQGHYGTQALQIISAHRKADGVVTNETSQHVRGTAADIRVPGVSVDALTAAAKALGAKGVGTYYQHSFVHVDVREQTYYWREARPAREPRAPESDAPPPL